MTTLSKNDATMEQDVTMTQPVRKRGSKSASIEATTTAKKEEIAQIVRNSYKWFNKQIVKSDDECADRLNEFFVECGRTGEIPTVEKMCLALGAVRSTVWEWENGNGCSSARSNMIKKAKQILSNIDAELVLGRKIPETTYIFRSKNFYGMKDVQDLVLTPNQPLGDSPDQKQLEERIAGSVVVEE